jgi:hypothetical protein
MYSVAEWLRACVLELLVTKQECQIHLLQRPGWNWPSSSGDQMKTGTWLKKPQIRADVVSSHMWFSPR